MPRELNTKKVYEFEPRRSRKLTDLNPSTGPEEDYSPLPQRGVRGRRRPAIPALGMFFFIGVALVGYLLFSAPRISKKLVLYSMPYDRAPEFLIPEVELSEDIRVLHKVRKGEQWKDLFEKFGFVSSESLEIVEAVKRLEEGRGQQYPLKVGSQLELRLNRRARLTELSFQSGPEHQVVIEYRRKRGYSAELVSIPRESAEHVAVGLIESSLIGAARKAGVSYQIVDELVDLFSDRVNFNQDLRKGDRFTVIFRDTLSRDRRRIGIGPILAAALDVNGRRLIAARYVGTDGKSRYFDGQGRPLGNSFLRYPLTFTRISSYFSHARFHPILGRRRPHQGVDFAAPIGTPVRSVADGQVLFAGRKGASGIMVHLKHNDRYETTYLHLSRIAPGLRKGVRVSRGQVIGNVGATGLATGPHLHFGFFDRGKYVDPLQVKLPFLESLEKGVRIEPSYLSRVLHTLNYYQNLNADRLYAK